MSENCDNIIIRTDIKPGDMGIVLQMRCTPFHEEFGFKIGFGIMTARALADFYENYRPDKERCFIAEMNGIDIFMSYDN